MTIGHYCMYTKLSSFKGVLIVSETPNKLLLSCELWLLTGCCDRCSTGGECLLKHKRWLEHQSRGWERPWVGPGALVRVWLLNEYQPVLSVLQQTGDRSRDSSWGSGVWADQPRPLSLVVEAGPVWPSQPLSSVITVVSPPAASPGQHWGQWAVRTLQLPHNQQSARSESEHSRQQNVQTHRQGWGLRVYTGTQRYIAQEESFNRLRKQTFLCSVIYTERDKRVKTIPRLQPNCPAEVSMSESVIVIIWSNQRIVKRVHQTLNQENSKSRTVVTKFDPCVDKNVQSSLWQARTARRSCGVPVGSSVFSNYLLHLSDLP